MPGPSTPSVSQVSPKRKRDQSDCTALVQPSCDLKLPLHLETDAEPEEERLVQDGSPRSKMTSKFHELRLKADTPENEQYQHDDSPSGDGQRKKIKKMDRMDGVTLRLDPTPNLQSHGLADRGHVSLFDNYAIADADEDLVHVAVEAVSPKKGLSSVTTQRTMKKKSRSKKSPPLVTSDNVNDDSRSLTWQEDEITVHDPDDPDDDGEGVNGVGFRPTAAMAYARAQRRKQQIADWKSREAKEARAKRSQRRNLGDDAAKTLIVETQRDEENHDSQSRKVRFVDASSTRDRSRSPQDI